MADDDIDYIDDLLDAPFKQQNEKTSSNGKRRSESSGEEVKKKKSKDENGKSHKSSRRSRSKERHKKSSRDEEKPKKSKDKDKDKDKRDERKRSRSKERRRKSRDRSKSRDRRRRSRSKGNEEKKRVDDRDDKRRERSKEKIRRRSRSKDNNKRRRSFSPRPFRRGRTPPNGVTRSVSSEREELAPEERDARTIFCMQLAQRIKARDLEEFFSSVGKVRDVRLITCNKTKRFKGIAYVEFKDPDSVSLALGLSGQRLLGIPIVVQHTQAEKNRLANLPVASPELRYCSGPMRLYVGSLHFQVTEEMLGDIFKPFGRVDNIQLIKDPDTGTSKGYGFITYNDSENAQEALTQLNGFELAGRPMKVGNVTERLDVAAHASLDTDEMDRSGIDLGATGRLQLMCKLAEKTDLEIPQVTANALMASCAQPEPQQMEEISAPVASQCFLIANMFDPATETGDWDQEIRDDVIDECNKHGGVVHIFVDSASDEGKVYVKCTSKATAVLAVNALHGRWFAGRIITAVYVPLETYHHHFPEAITATHSLKMKRE